MKDEEHLEVIKRKTAEIVTSLKHLSGWVKEIKIQTTKTNGRVTDLEKAQIKTNSEIDLIKAIKKEKERMMTKMEDWSRAKMIIVMTGIFTGFAIIFGGIILWIIQKIIENALRGG